MKSSKDFKLSVQVGAGCRSVASNKFDLKQTTKSKLKTSIKKLINYHQKVFKKFEFELKW